VNTEVAAAQLQAGFYDPAYPSEVTEGDFAGWAPLSDRIQIWFSRYAAGPGAMGAVTVSVPYPGRQLARRSAQLLWATEVKVADGCADGTACSSVADDHAGGA